MLFIDRPRVESRILVRLSTPEQYASVYGKASKEREGVLTYARSTLAQCRRSSNRRVESAARPLLHRVLIHFLSIVEAKDVFRFQIPRGTDFIISDVIEFERLFNLCGK